MKSSSHDKSKNFTPVDMKGRWTIKWGNNDSKTFGKLNQKIGFKDELKEYQEIEAHDYFNVSSKSKGDLDYLKETHMTYKSYFTHLKESADKIVVALKSTDVLSFKASINLPLFGFGYNCKLFS